MDPSDDDQAARVPDAESSDAARSSELPAAVAPRAIGSAGNEGVDPRPSGSVVFDVEVDDPSLVMARPSRRARPKATGEPPIEESEVPVAEIPGPADVGDPAGENEDGDHGDDDDDDDDQSDGAPRQLVSGDPLLTGPTPVVRRAPRSSRSTPPAPADQPTEPALTGGDEQSDAEETPAAEESGGVEESTGGAERARPPLSPKDLFEPVTGEHTTVDTDVPPPPATPGPGASAPPPPPAPSLADNGTPAPGIARTTPPTPPTSPTPVVPAARRATRGSHVTGPIPTMAVPRSDPSGPVPAPRPTAVAPAPRTAGRRPRVRRVTRVVRHVDPWSVFKVAAVFSFVAYAICLVAGVLLWNVAYATGTVDNIERGLESTGWETFELNGGEIFHNAWIGGLFAAVGLTGLAVLTATLFNLITDLVGGVRLTVLEEEVVEKTASPMRRFASRRAPDPVPPSPSRR